MKLITKKANLSPTDIFLLSLLAGGGIYGGGRLIQDAQRAIRGNDKLPDHNNDLRVELPVGQDASQLTPEQLLGDPLKKVGMDSETKNWVAGGIGLPVGFLAAKKLYDSYQEHELEQELEETKLKYRQALVQAKYAHETPCVDGFCDIIKQALDEEEKESPHSLFRAAAALLPGTGLLKSLYAAIALTAAAGSFGTMYVADQNRRNAEQRKRFPEKVVLG